MRPREVCGLCGCWDQKLDQEVISYLLSLFTDPCYSFVANYFATIGIPPAIVLFYIFYSSIFLLFSSIASSFIRCSWSASKCGVLLHQTLVQLAGLHFFLLLKSLLVFGKRYVLCVISSSLGFLTSFQVSSGTRTFFGSSYFLSSSLTIKLISVLYLYLFYCKKSFLISNCSVKHCGTTSKTMMAHGLLWMT